MTRRTTPTMETLLALGADKLAKLVLEEVGRNASFKKMVTAALAGAQGPEAVAAIIDRRLAGLERARGLVDWDRRKDFAADLGATLATIMGELGAADPASAMERLIRFLACAPAVFERVDDSSGQIEEIFRGGADALPPLAEKLPEDARFAVVARLVETILADEYSLIETAVGALFSLLPPARLLEIDAGLEAKLDKGGVARRGADLDWKRAHRRDRITRLRQALADGAGNVDAYVELEMTRPDRVRDSLAVAERLLAAGRAAEALEWVRRPGRPGLHAMNSADLADGASPTDLLNRARVRLEVRILMALGQRDAAQDLRWRTFEAALDDEILRDYVAHLPDFEEFDALERAFAYAEAQPSRYRSLGFFLAWPHLDRAARLVLDHRAIWAGRHYDMLRPAAEALEPEHPAAATILYRALIDDVLARARSSAYGHAARYLAKLDELSAGQDAIGSREHQDYRALLQRTHGRKSGFWSLVEQADRPQRKRVR